MQDSESPMTRRHTEELLQDLRARLVALERMVLVKPPPYAQPASALTVLVVLVNGVKAALAIDCVSEVVPYAQLTPIPEAPDWVAGILDLDGQPVCVLDASARIGGASHTPNASYFIVICCIDSRLIGVCVESLHDVLTFPPEAVAPPPPDVPVGPYLVALILNEESPLLLLSVEQLLRLAELSPAKEDIWQAPSKP